MSKKLISIAVAAVALIAMAPVAAQDVPRTYDLGPVVQVSNVRVEPGQLRTYMNYLSGTWRTGMEQAKARGDVLSYGIYAPMDGRDQDGNLQLVVVFRNAAVMDTPLDELDRRTAALQGSVAAADQGAAGRVRMRTILGTQLLRELRFRTPAAH
jgi:hypothetical protein